MIKGIRAKNSKKPPITQEQINTYVDSFLSDKYKIEGRITKEIYLDLVGLFKTPLIKKAFQVKLLNILLKEGRGGIAKTNYWKVITHFRGCNNKKCEVCGGRKKIKIDCNSLEHLDSPELIVKDMNCLCESCIKRKYSKPMNKRLKLLYFTTFGLSAIICGLVYYAVGVVL